MILGTIRDSRTLDERKRDNIAELEAEKAEIERRLRDARCAPTKVSPSDVYRDCQISIEGTGETVNARIDVRFGAVSSIDRTRVAR